MVNKSLKEVSCSVSDCGVVGTGVLNLDLDFNVVKSMYAPEIIFSSIRGTTGKSGEV